MEAPSGRHKLWIVVSKSGKMHPQYNFHVEDTNSNCFRSRKKWKDAQKH
jgi:hypothetical protein